jgi:hypothetical protein
VSPVCASRVKARRFPRGDGHVARRELGRKREPIAGVTLGEALCLSLVMLSPLIAKQLHLPGATAVFDPARAGAGMTLSGWWYWYFCLPLFRFLLFRWLWRLGIWWDFLRRVAKLDLHLVPTHPDRAGGLGYLEVVHTNFFPLVFAFSAVLSASFAEGISTGKMASSSSTPPLRSSWSWTPCCSSGPCCSSPRGSGLAG